MEVLVLPEVDGYGDPALETISPEKWLQLDCISSTSRVECAVSNTYVSSPDVDSNNTETDRPSVVNMSGSLATDANTGGDTVAVTSTTINACSININHQQKLKMPKSTKRMFVGFNVFAKERRSQLKSSNPEMTHVEVIRQVSKEWSKMSSEMKKKYKESAYQDRLNYEQALALGINPKVKFQDCKIKKEHFNWVINDEGDLKIQNNISVSAMATTSSSFDNTFANAPKSYSEAATGKFRESSRTPFTNSVITELHNSLEVIPIFTEKYLQYNSDLGQEILETEKRLKDSRKQFEILAQKIPVLRAKLLRLDEEAKFSRYDSVPYVDAYCLRQLTSCVTSILNDK